MFGFFFIPLEVCKYLLFLRIGNYFRNALIREYAHDEPPATMGEWQESGTERGRLNRKAERVN